MKTELRKFEHVSKKLLPVNHFYLRQSLFIVYAISFLTFSLIIGTAGYAYFGNQSMIDAFYNACMILTGMGPGSILTSNGAKLFSSFYALYSGVAFLTTVGVLFAPVVHRFLHVMHVENKEE